MKILAIPVLASLALMMSAPVRAQSATPAPLSKRDRIELCKKKRSVPLEPAESQPLSLDGKDGTVTRPTILDQVAPRAVGGYGRVVLEAVIDEDGCVRQAKVLQSAGGSLDGAAITAVQQWVFLPATRDGHPVRVRYFLSVGNN